MLTSSDQPLPIRHTPVEVVFLGPGSVVSHPGHLLTRHGNSYDLALDETPPEPADGNLRVVLSIGGEVPARSAGHLISQRGKRVTVETRETPPSDNRRFPRLLGAIGLRWRSLEAEGAWHEPDPLMNFSVVGFAFGGPAALREGELLDLDFQVGGEGPRHGGTGRVVRTLARSPESPRSQASDPSPDSPAEADTHDVSVELIDTSLEAREALAELTLRIQRAFTDLRR